MGPELTIKDIPAVHTPTPEQRRAASRVVLRHARSREDLRLLLDALGLNTTTASTTKGE